MIILIKKEKISFSLLERRENDLQTGKKII
jgi:hypothetical protein